jgi:hypothetical protein
MLDHSIIRKNHALAILLMNRLCSPARSSDRNRPSHFADSFG